MYRIMNITNRVMRLFVENEYEYTFLLIIASTERERIKYINIIF